MTKYPTSHKVFYVDNPNNYQRTKMNNNFYPTQLDFLEGKISPTWIQAEKMKILEEQQNKLRKSLFKRWDLQEKKIESLEKSLEELTQLIKK